MKIITKLSIFCGIIILLSNRLNAQNPLITDQFTADPSARVFGDRVYVYPSHDILATKDRGRLGWFCMEDYHVFSSTNLTEWSDHGMILHQNNVPWVRPDSYSMWAPDCIYRNGKYYFYFPSNPKDTTNGRRFTIGVAIADSPAGPFVPQQTAIEKVKGIDPNVFIDNDGQAYLYWSQGHIYGAKLKENMVELDSEPKILKELPSIGLKEGPYVFERNGVYYLTYPHVENKIERLEYAIGVDPLGPFDVTGVIMDESPTGCWTNHHSIVEFKNQWYLFYHHNDLSPKFDKARSIRMDSLSFDKEGAIKKVTPTLRGVGLTAASSEIQVDRYSKKSEEVSIAFLDTADTFKGWKTVFTGGNGWIQYNSVDFGKTKNKSVTLRTSSKAGGRLQIHLDSLQGPLIAELKVPAGKKWTNIKAPISMNPQGVHHLIISMKEGSDVDIDWLSFK